MQKSPTGPSVYWALLLVGPLLIAIGLYDTLMRPGIHFLPLAAGFLLLAAGLRYRKQVCTTSETLSEESRPYV